MASLLRGVRVHINEALWALTWIPDGDRLLIATGGPALSVWEFLPAGEANLLQKFKEARLGVVSVDYAQNESDILILSSSLDGYIRIYSFQRGCLLHSICCGSANCWQISCYGNQVATGTNTGETVIYNMLPSSEGMEVEPRKFPPVHDCFTLATQFSPDGKQLAIGYSKGKDGSHPTVCIYDTATGNLKSEISGPCDSIRDLNWGGTSKYLFVASNDLRVHIVDVEESKVVYIMSGHRGWVTSVSVSPDQQSVASVSTDGRLKIWDISTGQTSVTCQNHEGPVWSCKYSPTGRHLATCGEDGYIYCYTIPQ